MSAVLDQGVDASPQAMPKLHDDPGSYMMVAALTSTAADAVHMLTLCAAVQSRKHKPAASERGGATPVAEVCMRMPWLQAHQKVMLPELSHQLTGCRSLLRVMMMKMSLQTSCQTLTR